MKLMKTCPVMLLAVCSCLSGAQATITTQEIPDLVQALGVLQTQTQVDLQLNDTETIAGVPHRFLTNLYWSVGTSVQVELDEYDMAVSIPSLTRRYVGDGHNLWTYDVQGRRFAGTGYSALGVNSTDPVKDAPQLLAELYAQTRGWSTYMVRLLKESNPPSLGSVAPLYESWDPSSAAETAPVTFPPTPIPDPIIPTRYYTSSPTNTWIIYGLDQAGATRSVAFNLVSSSAGLQFDEIDFAQMRGTRTSDWFMTALYSFTNPIVPAQATLPQSNAFVPYPASATAGWQPIANVKLSG